MFFQPVAKFDEPFKTGPNQNSGFTMLDGKSGLPNHLLELLKALKAVWPFLVMQSGNSSQGLHWLPKEVGGTENQRAIWFGDAAQFFDEQIRAVEMLEAFRAEGNVELGCVQGEVVTGEERPFVWVKKATS